jgi:hypothetical protein
MVKYLNQYFLSFNISCSLVYWNQCFGQYLFRFQSIKSSLFVSSQYLYSLIRYDDDIIQNNLAFVYIVTYTGYVCGIVTNNSTWVRIGYRIYSLWDYNCSRLQLHWQLAQRLTTKYTLNDLTRLITATLRTLASAFYNSLWAPYSSDSGDQLTTISLTHWRRLTCSASRH